MNFPFTPEETRFIHAWAVEDHRGQLGPARLLQRTHDVNSAVMGQLVARLSTLLDRSQHDLVEGNEPEGPVSWPWSMPFDSRLKEILPVTTVKYLEDIGALRPQVGAV